MRKTFVATLLVAISIFVSGCTTTISDPPAADVEITNGWVRATDIGMTGAFATFTNTTDHVISILGGSSDIAPMVEAHEVVMLDGAMKMRAKDGGIQIQPGQKISLEPGGLHIMLMGLTKPILEGDKVTLNIDFDGTEDLTVTWPVKTSAAGDETYVPKH